MEMLIQLNYRLSLHSETSYQNASVAIEIGNYEILLHRDSLEWDMRRGVEGLVDKWIWAKTHDRTCCKFIQTSLNFS